MGEGTHKDPCCSHISLSKSLLLTRWVKVAEGTEGKEPEQCEARYRYVVAMLKQRKLQKKAAKEAEEDEAREERRAEDAAAKLAEGPSKKQLEKQKKKALDAQAKAQKDERARFESESGLTCTFRQPSTKELTAAKDAKRGQGNRTSKVYTYIRTPSLADGVCVNSVSNPCC